MKSILDLLSTIIANPHLTPKTRVNARMLRSRLGWRDSGFFGDTFGCAR